MWIRINEISKYLADRPNAKKVLDQLLITYPIYQTYSSLTDSGVSAVSIPGIIEELRLKFELLDDNPEFAKWDKRVKSGVRIKGDIRTFALLSGSYGADGRISRNLRSFMESGYARALLNDDIKLPFLLFFNRLSNAPKETGQLVRLTSEKAKDDKTARLLANILKRYTEEKAAFDPDFAIELKDFKKGRTFLKGEGGASPGSSLESAIEDELRNITVDNISDFFDRLNTTLDSMPSNVAERNGELTVVEPKKSQHEESIKLQLDVRDLFIDLYGGQEIWNDYAWILAHSPSAFAGFCVPSDTGDALPPRFVRQYPIIILNNHQNLSHKIRGKMEFGPYFRDFVLRYRMGLLSVMYHSLAYDIWNDNLVMAGSGIEKEREIQTLNRILVEFNGARIITDSRDKEVALSFSSNKSQRTKRIG